MTRTSLFSGIGILTTHEAALVALLDGVSPIAPCFVPLDQALGHVAAQMPALVSAQPVRDVAATNGWACRALDLVGATAYSPSALPIIPAWVETGDPMPSGCDCVLEADVVDCSGPVAQAVSEASPGHGVRRAGEDLLAGSLPTVEGRTLRPTDLLLARKVGLSELAVRIPRVRIINVVGGSTETFSTRLIAECLHTAGATIAAIETCTRDVALIAAALEGETCDLLILIGGTGEGRADVTSQALARQGALSVHGIALSPGRTTAIGQFGSIPVVAVPGSPDQAFGAFLAVVLPVVERLSGRSPLAGVTLPLSRKIASTVGLCEIVLLCEEQQEWTPLAVGDFSLDSMRLADAWLAVRGASEGYAAGTPVSAVPLRIDVSRPR